MPIKAQNAHTLPVSFRTLDLLVECLDHPVPFVTASSLILKEGLYECSYDSDKVSPAGLVVDSASPILPFMRNVLEFHTAKVEAKPTAVKFVLALEGGWLVRTDILEQRLLGCRGVNLAATFLTPDQKTVSYQSLRAAPNIFEASIRCAFGGIILNDDFDASPETLLEELEVSMNQRMAFPWIIPREIPCKRLAVIGGRHISTMAKFTKAARALNIKLVVLGPSGHWLENSREIAHREAFLPIDMTINETLPQRIVDAITRYTVKVDGITTFTDWLLISTAQAAEILHLPSAPAKSFFRSTDKHTTRMMDVPEDFQVIRMRKGTNQEQQQAALRFPVVVKPCRGWNSDGVLKATSEPELKAAIQYLLDTGNPYDVVIETYISGPEVDANFVLADGKLLFFELIDDFPSAADLASSSFDPSTNFLETNMLYPSALPAYEHNIVRDTLHAKLLALGFRTGIFHLEARVLNSSMQYRMDTELDLHPIPGSHPALTKAPKPFLIEINARAPGSPAISATLLTSGIDYCAIHLLSALPLSCPSTLERLQILSMPFPKTLMSTSHCNLVFIPVTHGGIFASDDVCAELSSRRPDLMSKVTLSHCYFKKGMHVPDPSKGTLAFVAYFCVLVAERSEAIRLGNEIRREVRVVIE